MEREQRTPNQRLRYERSNRGWSQKRVTDALETTKELVSKWECGTQTPSKYYQEQLCLLFGKSASELGFLRADTFHPQEVETTSEMHTINALTEAVADTAQPTLGEAAAYVPLSTEHASPLLSTHSSSDPSIQATSRLSEEPLETPFFNTLLAELSNLLSSFDLHIRREKHDAVKRETIRHLIAMLALMLPGEPSLIDPDPWERLTWAQAHHEIFPASTLDQIEHLLSLCWDLSNTQALDMANRLLSSFLPMIVALPPQEGRVAMLASQSLRLWSILTHHRLYLAHKVDLCKQSVSYARYAHDPNCLVPALIELAGAYEYTNQSEKQFTTLQEALFAVPHASPLIQSRAYSRYAVILAERGRKKEAQFYIGFARDVFPDQPTHDPGFAFADSSIFRFSYHAGLVHLLIGEASQADDAFELYKQHPAGISIPDRIRLEIANGQSRAAILRKDVEGYASFLEEVIVGSVRLGSKKRFDEAYHIFRSQMPAEWLTHPRLRLLAEAYHLNRGV